LKKIEKDIIVLVKKLSNKKFIDKAPPEVIEKDNQRKQNLSKKQTRLNAHLETIDQALSWHQPVRSGNDPKFWLNHLWKPQQNP